MSIDSLNSKFKTLSKANDASPVFAYRTLTVAPKKVVSYPDYLEQIRDLPEWTSQQEDLVDVAHYRQLSHHTEERSNSASRKGLLKFDLMKTSPMVDSLFSGQLLRNFYKPGAAKEKTISKNCTTGRIKTDSKIEYDKMLESQKQ